jgi:hypothetical protein
MATQSFMGKGTVYLQAGTGPLVSIGNVSKLSISVAEDRQDQIDYENAGGGVAETVSRVKSATLDLTGYSFSPENLALAVRGTAAAVTAASVVDEAVVAVKGSLHVLANIPSFASADTFTVEGGLTDTTMYVEGTDYVRTRSGFTIPSTSTITEGDTLIVNYKSVAGSALQGLVQGAINVRMVFEGLNEANSGKAVIVEAYRVLLSPTKTVDLISDKFGELQLNGTLLKDTTKTAAGASQYFTIKQAA